MAFTCLVVFVKAQRNIYKPPYFELGQRTVAEVKFELVYSLWIFQQRCSYSLIKQYLCCEAAKA